MSSNISDPLQKKSDNPSITVIKTSGDLDETEKALVTTNGTVVKEGNNDIGTKPNVVKRAITPPIAKNNILPRCAYPKVDLMDQPTIVSDPVSSASKSSIVCFPSERSFNYRIKVRF